MYTKYYRFRFGSGSLAQNFKGSGSVQVHRFEIIKVRVWFRFNDLKFKRLRFGSGSPKKSGFYRFAVQVLVRFDSLWKSPLKVFMTTGKLKSCFGVGNVNF